MATDLLRGDHQVTPEILDVADVMQHAFDAEIADANEKAIAFRFIPRHSGDVVSGERELGFVMRAVLNNAVKVSSAGSAIEVSTFTEGGRHKLTVLDTGCGLPDEMREHVFEPFGRAHCSRYADGQSLSLFLCRKLLEIQGGTIDLHNHPSGGAICEITLPVADLARPGSH